MSETLAASSHPQLAHFLVKPRLQAAGQAPRYPPPREGTARGDNYALPSQTSEIDGFGRFGRIRSFVVRSFKPGRGWVLPAFLPVLCPELPLPGFPAYGGYGYRGYGNGHD